MSNLNTNFILSMSMLVACGSGRNQGATYSPEQVCDKILVYTGDKCEKEPSSCILTQCKDDASPECVNYIDIEETIFATNEAIEKMASECRENDCNSWGDHSAQCMVYDTGISEDTSSQFYLVDVRLVGCPATCK